MPERVNRETAAAAISNSGIFVSTLTYSGPEKELLRYALRQKTHCSLIQVAVRRNSSTSEAEFFPIVSAWLIV